LNLQIKINNYHYLICLSLEVEFLFVDFKFEYPIKIALPIIPMF